MKYDELNKYLKEDVKNANSLPFYAYSSKEVLEKEYESVFHNDWVFVCHEKELENENDYLSMIIADEPILIKRVEEGEIKAFSNICRHRGTILVEEGFGNSKKLICPYHAWNYGNKGELLSAPFCKKEELDKSKHCLKEFNLEIWQGLVFINLSGSAEPLKQRYKEIKKYLEMFNYSSCTKAFNIEPEEWNSNWKLAFENGIESYHLFVVHKDTLETITPTKDAFYLEGCPDYTVTAGAMKSMSLGIKELLFGEEKQKDYYVLISLPPSFIGILNYESLSWIAIYPKSENECIVKSAGVNKYGSAGSSDEQEFAKEFLLEDKKICELVQKGMNSKYSSGGKLLEVEKIVVDFHNYLSKKMFNETNFSYNISDEVYEWFDK